MCMFIKYANIYYGERVYEQNNTTFFLATHMSLSNLEI